MSDTSDTLAKKTQGARVTLRLSERELARLRDLAEAREDDLTTVIRAAIGAYLDHTHDAADNLMSEIDPYLKSESRGRPSTLR